MTDLPAEIRLRNESTASPTYDSYSAQVENEVKLKSPGSEDDGNTLAHNREKRRRRAPSVFKVFFHVRILFLTQIKHTFRQDIEFDNDQLKIVQQAVENSKAENYSVESDIPEGGINFVYFALLSQSYTLTP